MTSLIISQIVQTYPQFESVTEEILRYRLFFTPQVEAEIMRFEYQKLGSFDLYKVATFIASFGSTDLVRQKGGQMIVHLLSRNYYPAFIFIIARPWVGTIDANVALRMVEEIMTEGDPVLQQKLLTALKDKSYLLRFARMVKESRATGPASKRMKEEL